METGKIVGLDLGGTKLAAAMFRRGEDGGVVFERALDHRKYDAIFGERGDRLSPEAKSRRIAEAMVAAVNDLAGQSEAPAAVGICSAGFVEGGTIVEAWNTGMKNYPLRGEVEKHTGAPTFLYKDSWAPVFAVRPERPAIIFSIGTGFGGVSCEPDLTIRIRSYTARKRIIWIPMLYCNDDPGYAVSFSVEQSAELMKRAVRRAVAGPLKDTLEPPDDTTMAGWAELLKDAAKAQKRLSPSRLELTVARTLAKEAASRIRPGEVFADVPGAAIFPPMVYSWLTGNNLEPRELDSRLDTGDPAAALAFFVQAEFIGYILYRMQSERAEFGLPPAELVFATGSGYNPVTHRALRRPVIEAMSEYCAENDIKYAGADSVEYLTVPGDVPTTLACLGAATGAARGISVD